MLMKRRFGGYTLLEVMLFLAISLLIFVTSVIAVRGQIINTEFITSANEVNAQMQQWIDQVQNGESGSNSSANNPNFSCRTTTISGKVYPQLLDASQTVQLNERGSNAECIYLGKAILSSNFAPNNNHLYAIPIVGLRQDPTNAGQLPTSYVDAHPIAAIHGQNGNPGTLDVDRFVDLVDNFTLPNNTRILWQGKDLQSLRTPPCSNHPPPNNDPDCTAMVAIFTNPSSSVNGAQSVLASMYRYGTAVTGPNPLVGSCIALVVGCGASAFSPQPVTPNLDPMSTWEICLFDPHSSWNWAQVTISSSNGYGASSSLRIGRGLPQCP